MDTWEAKQENKNQGEDYLGWLGRQEVLKPHKFLKLSYCLTRNVTAECF